MIDFKMTLQADELLKENYEKISLISEIMFKKFLQQFKTRTVLPCQQNLDTLCCQGNLLAIMDFAF